MFLSGFDKLFGCFSLLFHVSLVALDGLHDCFWGWVGRLGGGGKFFFGDDVRFITTTFCWDVRKNDEDNRQRGHLYSEASCRCLSIQ